MEDALELRWYFSVLRRWLWLIVICSLLGGGSAYLVSSRIPPVYSASTSLMVRIGGPTDDYAAVRTSQLLATTYTQLLVKQPVIDAAAQILGLESYQIEENVQVRLVPDTLVIELTVEDNNPRMAVQIANAIVAAFMEISRESGGFRARDLTVVEPATMKQVVNPIRPRILLNTALAAVIGAMLAVGAAFLVEYLDDTIKTPDDVSRALSLGTLGAIGQLARGDDRLVMAAQSPSPAAEAFRVLRTNIRFSSLDRPLRTLLVTSPGPAEGKSIVVGNLAVALAQAGHNVVALDADLRHPRLHQLFDLDPRHEGLTKALLEGNTDGRLQPAQVEGLVVLTSGELPSNPAEMLGSQRMQELLAEMAQQVDLVLLDSPPVLPVADATALAQAVDGVLLVLEAGKTRRKAAQHAVERLRQVGANVVGVVLNAVPTHKDGYYYYSYHEYYGNGSGRRKHRRRRTKGSQAAPRRLFRRKRKADGD